MQAILWEWLVFLLHWIHVVAAITWLGFSFHTRELDRAMTRRKPTLPGAAGEVWSIRGFGIYRTVRYLNPQEGMDPSYLVWYFWPNLTLLTSGFLLLGLVFFNHYELYLVDPAVRDLTRWQAVGFSLAGLGVSWLIHEGLYRLPLRIKEGLHLVFLFAFLTVLSYLYAQIFSGRGVYMQMAMTLGLFVTVHFFVNILPPLRKMLKDPDRKPPSQDELDWYLLRGRHNNYLLLSVVFLMMAGHFPLIYASLYGWMIIPLVILSSAFTRHFFDVLHQSGRKSHLHWIPVAIFIAVAIGLSIVGSPREEISQNSPTSIVDKNEVATAETLIRSRCSMCHMHNPAWPGLYSPPGGVALETQADIRRWATEINRYAVLSTAMPPANITALTLKERSVIGAWIAGLDDNQR